MFSLSQRPNANKFEYKYAKWLFDTSMSLTREKILMTLRMLSSAASAPNFCSNSALISVEKGAFSPSSQTLFKRFQNLACFKAARPSYQGYLYNSFKSLKTYRPQSTRGKTNMWPDKVRLSHPKERSIFRVGGYLFLIKPNCSLTDFHQKPYENPIM